MASASTLPPNASTPYYPKQDELPFGRSLVLFLVLSVLLGACTIWILAHQYINFYALNHWSKVLGVLDSPIVRLEYLGLVYPHFPFYMMFPFHYIPMLNSGAVPYLVSTLFAAGLLTYWNRQLERNGYDLLPRLLFLLLIAFHPFFLWTATSGTQLAISMCLYYALGTTFLRLVAVQDTRAFMMLGVVISFYFFVDERVLYLMVALLPLLPLAMPQILLQEAAVSAYLVTFTPWVMALFAWAYVNWLYLNDPWAFMTSPDSAFRSAWTQALSIPYLIDYGGRLFSALGVATVYTFVGFPIIALLLFRASRVSYLMNAAIVLFALPFIGTALATADYYLPHPVHMLFLMAPAVMVALVMVAQVNTRNQYTLVLCMLVSLVTGWWAFSWAPSPEMSEWLGALHGTVVENPYEAERELGVWLDKNREETVLDDHLGFPALVSRGDARGIILPYTREFKTNLMRRTMTAPQVAIPDPNFQGAHDLVNQRFPRFYRFGQPGYALAYDRMHWRVYRRI